MKQDELEDFVEIDMKNVVELFDAFNEGTHGSAGIFDFTQLQALRKRSKTESCFCPAWFTEAQTSKRGRRNA